MAQKILIKRATKTALNNGKATLTNNEIVFATDTKQLGVKSDSNNAVNYMTVEGHTHAIGDITSGSLAVNRGGTGKTSFTANQVIVGGTSTTGALQSVVTGTSGYVLTSNGSGIPTWQAAPAPTLTKDSISTALKTSIANIELGESNGTARNYSVVIGANAQASSTYAIAIGRGSTAAQYAVGIGSGGVTAGGRATGTGAVSIGAESSASGTNSITIGRGAANSTANSVQLGNASVTSLKVGNYTVPTPTNAGTTGQVLTKTSTGSSWQSAAGGGETYATKRTSLSFTKNSFDEKSVILSADFRFIEVSGLANSGMMANAAYAGFFLSREFLKEGAYFVFNGGNLYYHGETGANARKLSIYADETNAFDTVIVIEHRYS